MSDNPTPRLRIAVLNRIFKSTGGGAERYSIALVEQLAQRHEIHVFAQQIEHQWPGVTYHKVRGGVTRPRWVNQLWFATATWWATRQGFDVVHSHENTWHGQVQTVHVLPIKYNLFQGLTGWRLPLRWLKVLTSPRLMVYLALEHFRYAQRRDRVVVPASTTLRATMAVTYASALSCMQVITPGVDGVPGPVNAMGQKQARRQLGLPVDGRCILFVGNDYQKKGLPTLLKAMRTLPSDCYLAVVGNAAQIAGMQEDIRSNGIAERVHFLGALGSVDVAYRSADCLAHPTLEDTFAMVVLEAMAHGLPVVVSGKPYCGISELLFAGSDALILQDPTDAESLAQAVMRTLFDPVVRKTLIDGGRKFASRHQWLDSALQQELVYLQVAGLKDQHVLLLDAGRKRLNAGPKARLDTAAFLGELGFRVVYVPHSRSKHVRRLISFYMEHISRIDLPRRAVVWCQFPLESTTKIVLKKAREQGLQTVVFIHDLAGLKLAAPDWASVEAELEEIRQYSKVLSLNSKISSILRSRGIESAAELTCWDYRCNELADHSASVDNAFRLVYAGNLSSYKSGFIYQLECIKSVNIELYGQGMEQGASLAANIQFRGAFNPDTPPPWNGRYFGLVWDGSSIEACVGDYGAYLAFNTPHKAALYFSRDLPVVIWRDACITPIILEYQAGLAVSSLGELEVLLAELSDEQYQELKRGAAALGSKVRSGYFVKEAALKITQDIQNTQILPSNR